MKVRLLKAFRSKTEDAWMVEFVSELGTGIARWASDTPEVQRNYEVELAVEDELVWGSNVLAVENNDPAIAVEMTGQIALKGYFEMHENDFASLSIGDALMMCEVHGAPTPVATPVLVKATRLALYDTKRI